MQGLPSSQLGLKLFDVQRVARIERGFFVVALHRINSSTRYAYSAGATTNAKSQSK